MIYFPKNLHKWWASDCILDRFHWNINYCTISLFTFNKPDIIFTFQNVCMVLWCSVLMQATWIDTDQWHHSILIGYTVNNGTLTIQYVYCSTGVVHPAKSTPHTENAVVLQHTQTITWHLRKYWPLLFLW